MSEVKPGEDGSPLPHAVKHLQEAERHLEHAREEEVAAEREVKEAIEEVEEAERGLVKVHVVHVNEVEHATFKESLKATLQKVWDKSYEELKVEKRPKDIFQTGGEHPKSLMSHLSLTMEQAREQKVIEDYHFGIVSETGGA